MEGKDLPELGIRRTFLQNHAGAIAALDFFVVPTVTFRLLYVLVVITHERRREKPPKSRRGGGRAIGIQARRGFIAWKGRGRVDGAKQGPAIGHIQTDPKGTQEGP